MGCIEFPNDAKLSSTRGARSSIHKEIGSKAFIGFQQSFLYFMEDAIHSPPDL
jgi:hypothetical protein